MVQCPALTRKMLKNPVAVRVEEETLDFRRARIIADQRARQISPDPMLLAWFNRSTGEFSPRVECCSEDRPAWLIYAESRGGDLIIDINDLEYVFIYRRGET